MGTSLNNRRLSPEEEALIRAAYSVPFRRGESPLPELAAKLNMLPSNVCRAARRLGLTSKNRKFNESLAKENGERAALRIATNGHPRGMLGKKHTPGALAKMSQALMGHEVKPETTMRALKTKVQRYGRGWMSRQKTTWKAGWREIGGVRIYARSRWEANYARYLEFLRSNGSIGSWEHEPETFWFEKIKRGCRSYLPDFRVTENDGRIIYHEVKGWMDPRSITKLKRMRIYHPQVVLRVIDGAWFKANAPKLAGLVKEWE